MIRRLTGRRPTKPWALALALAVALLAAVAAPAAALADGTISGNVTDSTTNAPISGIWVAASGNGQYVGTFTDSFGNYSVTIPAGTNYSLDFNGTNIDYAYVQKHVSGVDVTDGNTTTVNTALAPSAQISGTVTDRTTGLPVQNIGVAVYDTSGTYIENAAPTDASGHYTLTQLAAGSYRVVFNTGHDPTYLEPWWHDKPDFASADTITLAAGQTATADQALTRSAQISGTVTDAATGLPVPNALVEASDSHNGFAGATFTDSNGNYTLQQLPADSYTVLLGHASSYQEQWWQGVATQAEATPVTVVAGQTASGIDAALTSPSAPAGTAPPTISGTPAVGQTLTESHGTWTNTPTGYAYQWSRCDAAGANCAAIPGATGQTYSPVAADAGSTLRVTEIASNANGPGLPATSAATAVVQGVPASTAPPTISGTPTVGQTLTESHGTWTNNPTGYSYQWQRCDASGGNCTPIPGATSQTYSPVAADAGSTLRVTETASNAAGPGAPATSAQTAVVQNTPPVNSTPPTISGPPAVGQTLTESHGTWTNNPTGYSYQWQRCDASGASCTAIAGATAQTYQLAAADTGHTLRVAETASNASGPGLPATSAQTPVIQDSVPANSAPPTISGTPVAGQVLVASPGTWSNGPTSYAYQWQRCDAAGGNCTPIPGATAQAYGLGAGDVGSTLRVSETASNAVGAGTPATSAASAVVQPGPPANTSPPTISGSAVAGQTLGSTTGTWTNSPTSYSYQWRSCDTAGTNCGAIAGATSPSYTPGGADVGHTLRVTVTAANTTGSGAPADSAASAVVQSAPAPPSAPASPPASSAPPAVAGDPVAGQTLSVTRGAWSGAPSAYSYDWQRCDAAGGGCVSIPGATGQTYALDAGDVGHRIRVLETATNATGPGAPAASAAVGPVRAAPVPRTPAPELARSADVYPVDGTVLIELPGSHRFVPLDAARQIPFGSTIDATDGTAKLCTAHDDAGAVQCANFWAGEFRIGQRRAHVPITDIRLLGGSFAQCNARSAARSLRAQAARRRRSHRSVRHLWGNGKGHYRTIATQSATAVRGTYWLTDDRCDGSLTRVRRGVVAVDVFRLHRTVIVRAGHSYLATRP